MTLDMIENICDSCVKINEENLKGRRTFTIVTLNFSWCLRYSEISNIRKFNTVFKNSHMKILYKNVKAMYIGMGIGFT